MDVNSDFSIRVATFPFNVELQTWIFNEESGSPNTFAEDEVIRRLISDHYDTINRRDRNLLHEDKIVFHGKNLTNLKCVHKVLARQRFREGHPDTSQLADQILHIIENPHGKTKLPQTAGGFIELLHL